MKTKLSVVIATLFTLNASLAHAQTAGASPQAAPWTSFVPLAFVFVIFYFLLIRPQQKQQKARKLMLAELKKGDDVITSGGMHGKIVGVADNVLTVELAENVKVKMDRDGVLTLKKAN